MLDMRNVPGTNPDSDIKEDVNFRAREDIATGYSALTDGLPPTTRWSVDALRDCAALPQSASVRPGRI
jgi:hypothetical protein